jgi:ubiquinone/menaquinone biosynthesis C-methylase UbiE
MLPRILEPEVMDTAEEAADYDAMDHRDVNARFVTDLLAALEFRPTHLERTSQPSAPIEVLDVGTGTAQIPIALCRRLPAACIIATDLAEEMLALARRNIDRAGFTGRILPQCVDAKRMPYADARFPVVMSNSIVHHIPEPAAVFAEIVRVTTVGGLIFLRDLLRPETNEEVERLVALYAGRESPRQQQLFRQSLHAALTLDEVRELTRRAGLDPVGVRATSDRHWTLAVRRPQTS